MYLQKNTGQGLKNMGLQILSYKVELSNQRIYYVVRIEEHTILPT